MKYIYIKDNHILLKFAETKRTFDMLSFFFDLFSYQFCKIKCLKTNHKYGKCNEDAT